VRDSVGESPDEQTELLLLLTSELVTNAVLQSGSAHTFGPVRTRPCVM
jgi:hypothetical protein